MNQSAQNLNEDMEDDFSDVEVQIEDDTPEEDQNRPRTEEQFEGDVSDDELSQYSGNVQKRIKKLSWEKNEIRRAKEEAERVREEALRYAEAVYNENSNLKKTLEQGEGVLVQQAKGRLQAEIDRAKAEVREAHDTGDTEKLIDSQEKLMTLQNEKYRVESYKPTPRQQVAPPQQLQQQQQQAQQQSQPTEADLGWVDQNPWFGPNKEMTGFAYGVHDRLLEAGVAAGSKLYYDSIDEAMQSRFPEEFGEEEVNVSASPTRQAGNVVAPASRSSKNPRKVKLTSSAAAIAKRLGLTNVQYAAQVMKLKGYQYDKLQKTSLDTNP